MNQLKAAGQRLHSWSSKLNCFYCYSGPHTHTHIQARVHTYNMLINVVHTYTGQWAHTHIYTQGALATWRHVRKHLEKGCASSPVIVVATGNVAVAVVVAVAATATFSSCCCCCCCCSCCCCCCCLCRFWQLSVEAFCVCCLAK